VQVCDWWSTFCGLAGGKGAECTDNHPSAHPLDSLDLWGLIVGKNATSPREDLPLVIGFESDGKYSPTVLNQSQCNGVGKGASKKKDDCCGTDSCDSARGSGTGALIWGDYKLIVGKQNHNWHTPPDFPCRNTSYVHAHQACMRLRGSPNALTTRRLQATADGSGRRMRAPLPVQPRYGFAGAPQPDRLE
jgi:hypothetical protein